MIKLFITQLYLTFKTIDDLQRILIFSENYEPYPHKKNKTIGLRMSTEYLNKY